MSEGKILPAEGTHRARTNGQIVVAFAESGALCAYIPYQLVNSEVAFNGKHTMVIVQKDETVNTNTIKSLRAVWPEWDGTDPMWLAMNDDESPRDLSETEFEFSDCRHEEYTNKEGVTTINFKTGWLNAVGGGLRMPDMADRKSVLAKFGSKFRALSGGTTVKKPEPKKEEKKASAPSAPSAPKGPPSAPKRSAPAGIAPTATQDEAWTACEKAGIASNNNPEPWFAAIDATFGNGMREKQEQITPKQWGELKAKFES